VRGQPAECAGADAGVGRRGHRPAGHPGHHHFGRNASRRDGEPLNLKTFISELDVGRWSPVGVLDHRTALHLMAQPARAGVHRRLRLDERRDDPVTRWLGIRRADGPPRSADAGPAAPSRNISTRPAAVTCNVLADGDNPHLRRPWPGPSRCGADAVVARPPPLAVGGPEALGGRLVSGRPAGGPPFAAARRVAAGGRSVSGRRWGQVADRPVRTIRFGLAEPGRWAAQVDGPKARLFCDPQGIPEGRPYRRLVIC